MYNLENKHYLHMQQVVIRPNKLKTCLKASTQSDSLYEYIFQIFCIRTLNEILRVGGQKDPVCQKIM